MTDANIDIQACIAALRAAGVIDIAIAPDGASLHIAARAALPPATLALIQRCKPDLLRLLRQAGGWERMNSTYTIKCNNNHDQRQETDAPGAAACAADAPNASAPPDAGECEILPLPQITQKTQYSHAPHQDAVNPASSFVRDIPQKDAIFGRASVRSALARRTPGTEATKVTEVQFSASGRGAREQKTRVTERDRSDKSSPACPHPWHELYYLERALIPRLPRGVTARIDIYPAPLRLRLTRRDTGDALDIPYHDLARIAGPDDPALDANVAAVIDTMLDVWQDLAGGDDGHC